MLDIHQDIPFLESTTWRRSRTAWISGVVALNTALGIWIYVSDVLKWSEMLYLGVAVLTFVGVYLVVYVVSLKKRADFLHESNVELRQQIDEARVAVERERDRGLEHGLIRAGGSTYLILAADTRKGMIFYEDRRNVLLNCTTVHLIMAGVISQAGEQSLRSIGREVGKKFATTAFPRFIAKKAQEGPIREKDKIGLWVEYDRDAGFGSLRDNTHFDDEEQRYEGFIELHDSFLTEGRIAESENLCVFMEGYIEGVLDVIVGSGKGGLVVAHTSCGCSNVLPEFGCSFKLSYASAEPSSKD